MTGIQNQYAEIKIVFKRKIEFYFLLDPRLRGDDSVDGDDIVRGDDSVDRDDSVDGDDSVDRDDYAYCYILD